MNTWIVPFLCCYRVYAFTPPEDHVSQIKGELYVSADFVEQAIQLAEIRLSRLGFNKIMIFEEECKMLK
jgi:hypothetical protein